MNVLRSISETILASAVNIGSNDSRIESVRGCKANNFVELAAKTVIHLQFVADDG